MSENSKVRLTQMVTSAGCAAKIFPHLLKDVLKDIKWWNDENVLVGFDGGDDAGVYKISDDLLLIQTTDFFTPVVDDPFVYGQIAATNSLSDVYAMGGKPLSALNIVAFPQKEDLNILKDILAGGAEKAKEAKCSIIGGHSVDISNILYGLCVTGAINPKDLKTNSNAKTGDVLILTKALGTGLLNNSIKYSKPKKEFIDELLNSMLRLNRSASELMVKYNASSCTDVTGFGLSGHSMQMAKTSNKAFNFNVNSLPILDGALWAIGEQLLTRGDKSNRIYTEDFYQFTGKINTELEHLIFDPQTSGGLLISIDEKNSKDLLKEIIDGGDEKANIVGWVDDAKDDLKSGTLIFHY